MAMRAAAVRVSTLSLSKMWPRWIFTVCLKTVASAILADVEPGFQPSGKSRRIEKGLVKAGRGRHLNGFPAGQLPPSTTGWEARRTFQTGSQTFPLHLSTKARQRSYAGRKLPVYLLAKQYYVEADPRNRSFPLNNRNGTNKTFLAPVASARASGVYFD